MDFQMFTDESLSTRCPYNQPLLAPNLGFLNTLVCFLTENTDAWSRIS